MEKRFRIPVPSCDNDDCGGPLAATVSTSAPYLDLRCVDCGQAVDLGERGSAIAADVEQRARKLAKAVARSLIEIRDTAPRSLDDLAAAIRDPRHPFTAALLAGIAIVLMELSGFGIFIVLAWILGNLILNPIGWVLIVPVVAIAVAHRRIFERESFERISSALRELQRRHEAGDITDVEVERMRQEILAQAFDQGALEQLLREGGFERSSMERIKSAWTRSEIEWVRDDQHLSALFAALRNAKSHLYIYSGWLRVHVIDLIATDLDAALNRGVDVFIGFGWESPSGRRGEEETQARAIRRLDEMAAAAGARGRLVIRRFPNHSKVLVCDNEYVICGSANWLSNAQYHNREVSVRIDDPELAKEFASGAAADFTDSPGSPDPRTSEDAI